MDNQLNTPDGIKEIVHSGKYKPTDKDQEVSYLKVAACTLNPVQKGKWTFECPAIVDR